MAAEAEADVRWCNASIALPSHAHDRLDVRRVIRERGEQLAAAVPQAHQLVGPASPHLRKLP